MHSTMSQRYLYGCVLLRSYDPKDLASVGKHLHLKCSLNRLSHNILPSSAFLEDHTCKVNLDLCLATIKTR